jgi:hypothetical protein
MRKKSQSHAVQHYRLHLRKRGLVGEPPRKGGILAALRRSPLVGADLDLSRQREEGREVDL